MSTCNRWDLITALPEGVDVEDARRRLTPEGQAHKPYAYVGDAALEQLIRITASLDSLNPGEDQIIGQVRQAYACAQRAQHAGSLTCFAFETALRIAKKVRREVALAPVNTSLFSLAMPDVERTLSPGERVVVLGTGKMGTLAARALRSLPGLNLTLVNRTPAKSEMLARNLQADQLEQTYFLSDPPSCTALVCATPVRHLVNEALLERLPELRLVVDLGIPRNVEPQAAKRRGLRVLDVDSLSQAGEARREALYRNLAAAETLVQGELEAALDVWTERQLGPSITRLREWYLATIGETLPEEEAALLAHKFAHVPVKGLRALAREHGIEAAKTFLAETGLI